MASLISDDLTEKLMALQRRIVNEKRPVLVIFEGRSGRIVGRVINEFMNVLEPRGITYTHFIPEYSDSPREMLRYISREPALGKIAIYDRSWYSRIVYKMAKGTTDEADLEVLRKTARAFERYLTNNGVIMVKFYLDISDDTLDVVGQKFSKKSKNSTFLTDDHINPKDWRPEVVEPLLEATDTIYGPWDRIEVEDLELTMARVGRLFLDRVNHRFQYCYPKSEKVIEARFPNPRESADLTRTATGYKDELYKLSSELADLQIKLAASDRSLVLVFEGWDAAGKGGSIRRLTRALNPRGYYVVPVAAPVGDEKVHTYLWRFAYNMPKKGHIVIYDRSWYGRMMVEPIEGLCSEEEYQRSSDEIRGFERIIHDAGGIVIKFWMEISPDEQLRRFKARQENPLKSYKITDEDWRNREKWDIYEQYVDRMIAATNAPDSPWVVVESEDKKYGRLKVLRTVVDTLHRELD